MLRVCQNSCAGTELPRLPELRHLNLLHCSALTDAGLAAVAAQFPLLTGLQLKSGSLSDAGLTAIATLTSLERLDLVDCEALKGEGLRAILASLPYLQVGPPFPKLPAHFIHTSSCGCSAEDLVLAVVSLAEMSGACTHGT